MTGGGGGGKGLSDQATKKIDLFSASLAHVNATRNRGGGVMNSILFITLNTYISVWSAGFAEHTAT